MKRTLTIAGAAATSLLLLAGCSTPQGPEWEAWEVADLASDALAEVINQRPDVDCGKEPITMYDGHTIRCDVLSPETKDIFGADVTIRSTDSSYSADVKVDVYPSGSLQF